MENLSATIRKGAGNEVSAGNFLTNSEDTDNKGLFLSVRPSLYKCFAVCLQGLGKNRYFASFNARIRVADSVFGNSGLNVKRRFLLRLRGPSSIRE